MYVCLNLIYSYNHRAYTDHIKCVDAYIAYTFSHIGRFTDVGQKKKRFIFYSLSAWQRESSPERHTVVKQMIK